MPGGARQRSGPAPDPNALRRDRKSDAAGWTSLPAGEWAGERPDWPLDDVSSREAALWQQLWRRPQAELWEQNGLALEVALHVRSFAEAEAPGAGASLRTLVRQQADALLLTMPAMLSARVRIAGGDVRPNAKPSEPVESSRTRLRAVPDDAGG